MDARLNNNTTYSLGQMIRTSDAAMLAQELMRMRSITLAVFEAYEAAGALDVPQTDEFNPPLWELGHVGWFQQWWIGRNQQRHLGIECDPAQSRLPCPHFVGAQFGDDWYNSSAIAHAKRWHLPLLSAAATRQYLNATLTQTLECLSAAGSSDAELYFYRLVLLHEAMHLEAAVYMAQALELPISMPSWMTDAPHLIASNTDYKRAREPFFIKKRAWRLGSEPQGFVFDNELASQDIELPAYEIDAQPVSWAQYLTFVQSASYPLPRYVRASGNGFESIRFGVWLPLDMSASAVHISWHEAQAYCLWADRRLPTEAQWECAAFTLPSMAWGDVWEWTESDFLPYEGFTAHPYRDYSEPWFGSRKVLKGACAATLPIMRHAKYRNYFMPDRTDIYAGFRTCALASH